MGHSPVLIITSLEDATADYVIKALNMREVPLARVDTADIGAGLSFGARSDSDCWAGTIQTATRTIDLAEVRAIYHRRPSPYRFSHLPDQAAQFAAAEARHGLGGLLAALPVLHLNDPFATARAEYKPLQLTIASQLGLTIPATLITNDLGEVRRFENTHGPIVYKTFRGFPAAGGTAGAVWTSTVSAEEVTDAVAVTAHLFQARIDRAVDVRATMVGQRAFAYRVDATGARLTQELDWRSGDWSRLNFEPIALPDTTRQQMRAYLDHLGLVSGSFDFIVDRGGGWVFIECNPDGQWAFLPDPEQIADAFAALLQAG